MEQHDPHIWLEEVDSAEALSWVKERNAKTLEKFTNTDSFTELKTKLNEVLDSTDKIPFVVKRNDYVYNFWRDLENPRGLWRRTSLDEYRKPKPSWDIVLDIDELARTEDENWVWGGAALLQPNNELALVKLSRGGSDASVVREFNTVTKKFVTDGFVIPEAKTQTSWINADTIYVGTDFGPDSLTTSGYPRIVKKWRRGTALADAVTVFSGEKDDVSIGAIHDTTVGFERSFFYRSLDFYRREIYLVDPNGEPTRIPIPDDAEFDAHREWLLVHLRSPWQVNEQTFPAGALLATKLDDFMSGQRTMTAVFTPDEHSALEEYDWTQNHLILTVLRDVSTELRVLTPGADTWQEQPLAAAPRHGSAEIFATCPRESDEYFLLSTSYTQPSTLMYGSIGSPAEALKQSPEFFDGTAVDVQQYFAVSQDGTRIPYSVLRPKNVTSADNAPTLLYAYGGFEVSLTPYYSGTRGRGWLERGGTYVVANLRGGGEYGPDWHSQAVKANRHRVYEDCAAVAADLVKRGITTASQLAMYGGSNGGLVAGVMLTRYPQLFGAVVATVPLLDMRRYHTMLAGASWMAEYGDPDIAEEWAYIKENSPYHIVHSGQEYPPVLFLTSTRDDRVHPAHARKTTAKLEQCGHRRVYYYENIEGGHSSASNNAQLAFKEALTYEFLMTALTGDTKNL